MKFVVALNEFEYITDLFTIVKREKVQVNYKLEKIRLLVRILTHRRIEKHVPKCISVRIYNDSTRHIVNDDNLCFLFFQGSLMCYSEGYLSYLKIKYPNSKLVIMLYNPVNQMKPETLKLIQNNYDIVYSYNPIDCKNYNWLYFPCLSECLPYKFKQNYEASDVYFVGSAKDRLGKIYRAYEMFETMGIKCLFFLSGVKRKDQKKYANVRYIKRMKYIDNIGYIRSTKYLLEINQKNTKGYTLRCSEAIANHKRLISDNAGLIDAPFYSPELIRIIDFQKTSQKIEIEMNNCESVNYNYENEVSLSAFLSDIETRITT